MKSFKDRLNAVYGFENLGFHDFYDNLKNLCKNLKMVVDYEEISLCNFCLDNLYSTGKRNDEKIKKNFEVIKNRLFLTIQKFFLSNVADRQSPAFSFSQLMLNMSMLSPLHMYKECEREAKALSNQILELVASQPNAFALSSFLTKSFSSYKLINEDQRFNACYTDITNHGIKNISKEMLSSFILIYDKTFNNYLKSEIEKSPISKIQFFKENEKNPSQPGQFVDFGEKPEPEDHRSSKSVTTLSRQQMKDIIDKTFQNYIGMEDVKSKLESIIAQHRKGLLPEKPIVVMLTGNPGTGKTTAGELMTKVLFECGVIKSGNMHKFVASNLQAKYVGQTNERVKEIFAKARNGALFLDEIYSLAIDTSFNSEAITELLQQLENRENAGMFVISAGYEDKINDFFNKNGGLKDRFFSRINLRDFTHDELISIAKKIVSRKGCSITPKAIEQYSAHLEIAEKTKDFGNARYVANSMEEIISIQNIRTFDDPEDKTIKVQDVTKFEESQKKNKTKDLQKTFRIGFGSN